uniref:Kinesin motor domain-containing protein n=1 Tax=Cannabis sativa TaxID=3483 RepID=A0A803P7Y5_CANSA
MNSMTENRAKEHGRNSNVAANGDFSAQVLTSNGELEGSSTPKSESPKGGFSSPLSGEEKRKILSESKFQRSLKSPILSDPSTTLTHVGNYKFHEVFQLKQGRYMDLPPSKISEMMKSNSLDNAPTQSLLSVVNSILDESVERNNSEIPHQNNLFKAREEKYQSRIRVLEALAIGFKLKTLANAAQNYHSVLAENRKIFNELQELKGNIRVYCRIRPFLPGQKERKTIIEHIDENGELIVANPSKPGKDGHRLFKFNKVFGQASTQEDVFSDTQPLIRSVLDGYNVCIFAYGQTGSGKTYTMTGPNASSKENWGVNYRALSDLFSISQTRKSSISYEIGVQMIEIYNEQCYLKYNITFVSLNFHTLGIVTHYQPNGLAVPDASMHPVKSTSDVIELMEIGLKNRSVSFTALNERSSRSHSCVTIHVRGLDSKTGATLHGNLHLVDLAGSERVDRSEVTGDRLKEAQHINKSLSALGDVIFALAQKSSHVPYRNSKLTQVLQSSLGGQAKTLMFVQLNPDVISYSETMSTLKFAERVSGVELGAARSNKEGRDVRELVEQVASLRNTIAKKDEEIERLQLLKVHPGTGSLLKYTSPSLNRESEKNGNNVPKKSIRNSSSGKSLGGLTEKTTSSDHDNSSDYSDSQHSMEHDERPQSMSVDEHNRDHDHGDDHDHEDHHGDYDERLSDTSDNGTSIGADTDGSAENVVFAQIAKSNSSERLGRISRPTQKSENAKPTSPLSKGSLKISTSLKKTSSVNTTPTKSRTRQWQ